MDELNKPQQIQPIHTIAFEDIPTPEEHSRDVRRIFTVCGSFAVGLLLVAIAVVLFALRRGVPLQTIAFIVPIVMGIGITTFFIAYAMPVGLVSLKRLEIAYKMGYFGLGQNRQAVSAMQAIADRVKKETNPLPRGTRPTVEA